MALGIALGPHGGERGGVALASDVFTRCVDCPVGRSELAELAAWLREADVVIEARCVARDGERDPRSGRFKTATLRVERVVLGRCPDSTIRVLDTFDDWSLGARYLGGVLWTCDDGLPCVRTLLCGATGELRHPLVSSDWRPEGLHLTLGLLEPELRAAPDPMGLEAFRDLAALALVRLRDPRAPGTAGSWFPGNGGTRDVVEVGWLLGDRVPLPGRVRFPFERTGWGASARGDDLFLLPLTGTSPGDTLTLRSPWRALLVRAGRAVRLGVPLDSVRAEFASAGGRYHLRPRP